MVNPRYEYHTTFYCRIWIKKQPFSKSLHATFIVYLLRKEAVVCNTRLCIIFSPWTVLKRFRKELIPLVYYLMALCPHRRSVPDEFSKAGWVGKKHSYYQGTKISVVVSEKYCSNFQKTIHVTTFLQNADIGVFMLTCVNTWFTCNYCVNRSFL